MGQRGARSRLPHQLYYNPTPRDKNAEHVRGAVEVFDDADRAAMVATIQNLRAPAIHYKIFAAGRTDPKKLSIS